MRERHITYASRTLTSAERNYSQLDREDLGIVFAIKKFQMYLDGRHCSTCIYTEHKPLLGILGPHKPTPILACAHMQRWILTMSTYEYDLFLQTWY